MSLERRGHGTIYQRGAVWWIQFSHRGNVYRESAHSEDRKVAVKLLKQRLGDMGAGKPIIGPTEERVTFDDLEKIVIDDYRVNGRRSIKQVELAFRRLRSQFGLVRAVDITGDKISAWVADRLDDRLSHSSINYTLAMLRRAFRLLQRAGKIATMPYIALLEPDPARQGFLEPVDFARLHSALPAYLQDPVAFLYLSGWRVGEMRSLEWRDVDLAGRAVRLRAENSKNGRPRVLKLGGELLAIFERAHADRLPSCRYVFHNAGMPIGDFRKSWATARTAASLPVRVHDLRRSSVRNMVRAGIPERVAMEISGHKTRTVFERYNIVSETDLDNAVERLNQYVATRQQEQPKIVPLPQKAA